MYFKMRNQNAEIKMRESFSVHIDDFGGIRKQKFRSDGEVAAKCVVKN